MTCPANKLRLFYNLLLLYSPQVMSVMDSRSCRSNSYPPLNFSWVVEGKLAAMGWPRSVQNIDFLVEEGVKHLITLSPEKIPAVDNYSGILEWTVIGVEEFEPPTIEQINEFIEICKNSRDLNEAVGVHCRQGLGRTGVMAACYLVYFENLTSKEAIKKLRLQRPWSVETRGQEKIVQTFYYSLLR